MTVTGANARSALHNNVNSNPLLTSSCTTSHINAAMDPGSSQRQTPQLSNVTGANSELPMPISVNSNPVHSMNAASYAQAISSQPQTQQTEAVPTLTVSKSPNYSGRRRSPSPELRSHRARSRARARSTACRRSYAPSPHYRNDLHCTQSVSSDRNKFSRPWDQAGNQPVVNSHTTAGGTKLRRRLL